MRPGRRVDSAGFERRHGAAPTRMILVGAASLWCSLCVRSAGPRIEVIRFSLLVVLTVALLSVAFRIWHGSEHIQI